MKKYLNRIIGYSKHWILTNKLVSAVIAYMIFSVLLLVATGINICIPCLWTVFFGVHCPGCGLTHAAMDLMKLDVAEAWHHNPLIFLILPTVIFYFVWDFRRYVKRCAD